MISGSNECEVLVAEIACFFVYTYVWKIVSLKFNALQHLVILKNRHSNGKNSFSTHSHTCFYPDRVSLLTSALRLDSLNAISNRSICQKSSCFLVPLSSSINKIRFYERFSYEQESSCSLNILLRKLMKHLVFLLLNP